MDPALAELLRLTDAGAEAHVALRLRPGAAPPPGVRVVSRFGSVITARLRAGDVLKIRAHADVENVKASRLVVADPAWEDSLRSRDYQVERTALSDPEATGRGVVVAVLDWGCDFPHPNFRSPGGGTRFLALLDQRQPLIGANNKYGYGTVFTQEALDRAVRSPDPYAALGYHPADADSSGRGTHGTHVLDIAAGNGRAKGSRIGVAPEADLVFVHLASRDVPVAGDLGDSIRLLEALDFVRAVAQERPWVANLSLGRTGGSHIGQSLVELALDSLLEEAPGRAIVQSAGNYFLKNLHTAGQLTPGRHADLEWIVDPADITPNELEIWYSGRDSFLAQLWSPDRGDRLECPLGASRVIRAGGREVGRAYHRSGDPAANGDNHLDIFLYRTAPPGRWVLRLTGVAAADGRYHAWIERDATRPGAQSHFPARQSLRRCTLGTIANGFRTLVVGAYDPRGPRQPLARFSSSGPTRDGRLKPDIAAPGVGIRAARSTPRGGEPGSGGSVRMSGTSMAAPHVTGTVALIFEAAGRALPIDETRGLLLSNARPCKDLDPLRSGSGYLDSRAAVAAARAAAAANGTGGDAGEPLAMTHHNPNPTAGGELMRGTHEEYLAELERAGLTPDRLFRAFVDPHADIPGEAELLALPGAELEADLSAGDFLLRVAPGEVGLARLAVLVDGDLESRDAFARRGVAVERGLPGYYAVVREPGNGERARRITDSAGFIAPNQVLFRIEPADATEAAAAFPPSVLQWDGSSLEQLAFMRAVYERHVRRASAGRSFVEDVPESLMANIEGDARARIPVATDCLALLTGCRAELDERKAQGDSRAARVKQIGVTSAYRSASRQLRLWQRRFPKYYGETSATRADLEGGEHGREAVALLARYIGARLAAPGFSLHNDGRAVDFVTVEGGRRLAASTNRTNIRSWRASWFFDWLIANGARFNFYQNTSIDEPWHWEHRGVPGEATSPTAAEESPFPVEDERFSEQSENWLPYPVHVVLDKDARIRVGPPDFATTGDRIPYWTRVWVNETQGDHARVTGADGHAYGWTRSSNVGMFFKDLPHLVSAPLPPDSPVQAPSSWTRLRAALAGTYNRLGGLMTLLGLESGAPVEAVLAVWHVESGGRQHVVGKATIRFENHLFFDRWGSSHPAVYDQHFQHGGRAGVAGRRWENHRWREDPAKTFEAVHGDQQAEYRLLDLATRLSTEDTALSCISIGGPQILVSNHRMIGYDAPRAMYDAFQAGEQAHVFGFFDYCQYKYGHGPRRGELLRHLAGLRWADFARGYNGAGQVQRYSGHLQAAYTEALQVVPRNPTLPQAESTSVRALSA